MGAIGKTKNAVRARTHGFRARMETKSGRNIIRNRRRKGRYKLTVSEDK